MGGPEGKLVCQRGDRRGPRASRGHGSLFDARLEVPLSRSEWCGPPTTIEGESRSWEPV
jgi:hypothetical protein